MRRCCIILSWLLYLSNRARYKKKKKTVQTVISFFYFAHPQHGAKVVNQCLEGFRNETVRHFLLYRLLLWQTFCSSWWHYQTLIVCSLSIHVSFKYHYYIRTNWDHSGNLSSRVLTFSYMHHSLIVWSMDFLSMVDKTSLMFVTLASVLMVVTECSCAGIVYYSDIDHNGRRNRNRSKLSQGSGIIWNLSGDLVIKSRYRILRLSDLLSAGIRTKITDARIKCGLWGHRHHVTNSIIFILR